MSQTHRRRVVAKICTFVRVGLHTSRSLGTARADDTRVFSVSFVIRMSARCSRKPARTV